MTTINSATSGPPLQPTGSSLGKTNGATADATTPAGGGTTATGTPAPSPSGSSSVTISTISTQLQAAQAATASDAVYSTNKVNEIKAAISEGRFQVNSEKVANGLLDSVQDLLGSRQRG